MRRGEWLTEREVGTVRAMSRPVHLSPLTQDDLEAIRALVSACVDHDGGLPAASEAPFALRTFLAGPGVGIRDPDGSLVAAAALGEPFDGVVPASGAVHPSHRGRGIGQSLLEWVIGAAGDLRVQLRSECATEEFEDLAARFGFEQVFSEYVMQRSTAPPLDSRTVTGIEMRPWATDTVDAFFEAYTASFADRPGFPGWSRHQWVESHVSDEEFRPEASMVVTDTSGLPIAFVLVSDAWIEQIGVVPASRRKGIAGMLLRHAIDAIGAAGSEQVWLNVNENNPSALSLYEHAGFTRFGRRCRFERTSSS